MPLQPCTWLVDSPAWSLWWYYHGWWTLLPRLWCGVVRLPAIFGTGVMVGGLSSCPAGAWRCAVWMRRRAGCRRTRSRDHICTLTTCATSCMYASMSVSLSIRPSVHPSVHPSIHPFIHSSLHPPSLHHSITPSLHTSVRPCVRASVRPSVHRSIDPSVDRSI